MDKTVQIIMILLCTFMTVLPVRAQENSDLKGTSCVPVRTTVEEELAFQGGETMDFVLHYRWGGINTDVGSASVRLDTVTFNGEKAFCCTATGKTTKLFDLFFKVREDFRSWFTRDGLKPLKFTRDTYEGGYEARNTYLYDWNSPEPHIDADIYMTKKGQFSMDLPLTPCTYDLPALFFFARNMDIENVEPEKKYPMTFAIDDDVYNVYFILYGREEIKVKGLGTLKTIKFAAKLLEGEVFKGEEDMFIWISDDENRLPVYFEAPLRVGKATGRMTGYGGLKHPFTSLIKK
ncbi:MAG: DUF3108 domain-containing protein [Bacteroidales bacterium]|nr:DUF3108 domain-containing protein [Bacteroidales bacterium]